MKSKKTTVLMPFFLLACGIASYAQVPIDYENFVEYEKIYTVNSQSVIPANQSTKDYYIGTYFTDGRIDDWITVCGDDEDMPEVSAGKGVVEDVSIVGSDVLRVHFGQVRGRGKLIVALKVPPYDHQSDSLRIVVINYDKNGTAVPRPDDPRYKLGMRHFSIHTYADSLAQDTLTSKSYVDGFGRIVQTSGVGASPEGGDIIDIAEYDIMGRESKKYLPFVADTSGALVYNPAVQEKFYADKYKDSLNAAYAYSKTDYDGSPLGVVASTSPAGEGINSDSPDGGSPTVYGYRQNMVQDSIWHFELDSLNPCVVHKTGFYPKEVLCLKSSGLKVGNDTFDPVAEYYDCEGRKVMVQSSDASQRVYYVYDAFGRLCFTIPQVSAARMNERIAYDMTDSILSEYCYLKVYDKYGNVVREYTPGASPSIYIYDMRNRLVLAQDPSQRQKNLWAFSKYDIFDRPVMVGVIVGGTEEEYREAVSRDTVAGESRLYATTSVYPYTDECFPVLSQTEHEVYGINYYDNYDWTDIEWRGDADSVNYAVSGLLTRTASKVLGEDKWMNKVVYYDSRYRKIRQCSDLYPDGVETVRMSYDFQNRLTGEYVRQRTSAGTEGYDRTYSYDIEGRLLQIRQRVAGDTRTEEVELATYTYDDLGERLTRRFGNGTRTTYKRNLTGTNIIENGPVMLQRKYGNEVSYFGKRQPYTRLAEFTWINQRGKNGYAYDYDASGRLLEGAYLQVQGTSESQEDYDILVRNSVHLDYDTSTDNIACITRSGTPMPMNYSGYRMTNVQIPGDTMSGTFLYDAAGNLLYDAVSRQKYEYNPVGRLQTLWNVPENPTDTVSVYTDVWLTYDKVSNPAVWRQMHMLYPDYFDINGDIHSAYRAEQWNGEYYDFYYIPKKYPLLAGDSYSESGVGHTFEYLGGTPEKTAFVYYQGPEHINTSCWLYKRRNPSDGEALHEAYPDYFMSDGDISYSYLISGTTNCFMIPEHYFELADMGYVNTLTSGAYEMRYYSMEPPVPGYVPKSKIMIDNFIDIPVRRDKFVKFSTSEYSSAFIDYAVQHYPKYFDQMLGSIHFNYYIRDDYYYLPTEYSSLLRDPFSQFDFVDWEIIDYYPGLGTPPTIIEVPATDNKHMEMVYNGQGGETCCEIL